MALLIYDPKSDMYVVQTAAGFSMTVDKAHATNFSDRGFNNFILENKKEFPWLVERAETEHSPYVHE